MCIAGLTFLSKTRVIFPSLRLVCTGHTQTVVSVSSVLPYYKKNIKSRSVNAHIHIYNVHVEISESLFFSLIRHETQRERFRARGNSFSLQMDLEGVELGTTTEVYSLLHTLPPLTVLIHTCWIPRYKLARVLRWHIFLPNFSSRKHIPLSPSTRLVDGVQKLQEVSLAFLLNSVWISPDVPILTSDLDGPALLRRGSIRRSAEVNVAEGKRSSTPTPLARYLVTPEVIGGGDSGSVFRGDHRSPLAVILSYHPLFLNNDELFASPMTTTLTPPGYRAS